MTDKAKSEFDTATKQYFEQVAFAPDDRQPPPTLVARYVRAA